MSFADDCDSRTRLVEFVQRGDLRGSLVALEAQRQVPFEIRRVYYVFGTKSGVVRGQHAHRKIQQLAVSVCGAVTMLMDDGGTQRRIRLDRPDRGLLIPPMVWHEMHDFTPDCVLLVLADAEYDEADYIRDRAEFDGMRK